MLRGSSTNYIDNECHFAPGKYGYSRSRHKLPHFDVSARGTGRTHACRDLTGARRFSLGDDR
jgi:hypothetical protein